MWNLCGLHWVTTDQPKPQSASPTRALPDDNFQLSDGAAPFGKMIPLTGLYLAVSC